MARWVTLAWAVASTVAAGLLGLWKANTQVVETFLSISSLFTGPILGVFMLGILTRRPGGAAALIGLTLGTAATWYVSFMTNVNWLWYAPVGFLVTFLVGYIGGLGLPSNTVEIESPVEPVPPRTFEVIPPQPASAH